MRSARSAFRRRRLPVLAVVFLLSFLAVGLGTAPLGAASCSVTVDVDIFPILLNINRGVTIHGAVSCPTSQPILALQVFGVGNYAASNTTGGIKSCRNCSSLSGVAGGIGVFPVCVVGVAAAEYVGAGTATDTACG